MDWGMTFFAISCKFFFQILTYLEGKKKKSTIVAFIPENSAAIFKNTRLYVWVTDCSVGMSEVTFLLCLGQTSRVKQMSAWQCIVGLSIQKLSVMNCIKSSSCKDNVMIKVSPKFINTIHSTLCQITSSSESFLSLSLSIWWNASTLRGPLFTA